MSRSCPISFQSIDENQVRIQAGVVTAISVLFLTTGWSIVLLLLAYDFALRTVSLSKLSPLYYISKGILLMNRTEPVHMDAAPKLFAAQIGLAFSLTSFVLYLGGYETISLYLISVLAVCASFEAALNFCVGCWFHSTLNHFNIKIVSLKD